MNDANKARAAQAGALETCIGAIRLHLHHPGVQEQGCGALVNLCADQENAAQCVALGGVEMVVAALRVHPTAPAVLIPGCVALFNLTWRRTDVQKRAREAGAVPLLREVLGRLPPQRDGGLAGQRPEDRSLELKQQVLRDVAKRALRKIEIDPEGEVALAPLGNGGQSQQQQQQQGVGPGPGPGLGPGRGDAGAQLQPYGGARGPQQGPQPRAGPLPPQQGSWGGQPPPPGAPMAWEQRGAFSYTGGAPQPHTQRQQQPPQRQGAGTTSIWAGAQPARAGGGAAGGGGVVGAGPSGGGGYGRVGSARPSGSPQQPPAAAGARW